MISKGLVNKTWLHRFFGKINGNKFDISKLDHTLQSWESAQLNKILSKHTKTQKTTEERVEEMDSAQSYCCKDQPQNLHIYDGLPPCSKQNLQMSVLLAI